MGETRISDTVRLVGTYEESGEHWTVVLQLLRDGQAPVEFYRKQGQKNRPSGINEWLRVLDAIEVNGRVTVLTNTGIASFRVLQGGDHDRVESEQDFLSSDLESILNIGPGEIKLKSPTEVTYWIGDSKKLNTATISPQGVLHRFGKPCDRGAGVVRSFGISPLWEERWVNQIAFSKEEWPVPTDESKAASAPRPRVKVAVFAGMDDGELFDALRRGDLGWREDAPTVPLVRRIYVLGKKDGIYWTSAIRWLAEHGESGVTKEFLSDFRQAPSIDILPNAERGWRRTRLLMVSPKYVLAESLMTKGDEEARALLWQQFADMSTEDQMVVALVANQAPNLIEVQAILKAAEAARNARISDTLLISANQLVAYALGDPATRDEASQLAVELKEKGVARDFLLERMK